MVVWLEIGDQEAIAKCSQALRDDRAVVPVSAQMSGAEKVKGQQRRVHSSQPGTASGETSSRGHRCRRRRGSSSDRSNGTTKRVRSTQSHDHTDSTLSNNTNHTTTRTTTATHDYNSVGGGGGSIDAILQAARVQEANDASHKTENSKQLPRHAELLEE